MDYTMANKSRNIANHNNPLFVQIIHKLLILTLKPILLHVLMMIFLSAKESSSTHETARDGTKYETRRRNTGKMCNSGCSN